MGKKQLEESFQYHTVIGKAHKYIQEFAGFEGSPNLVYELIIPFHPPALLVLQATTGLDLRL